MASPTRQAHAEHRLQPQRRQLERPPPPAADEWQLIESGAAHLSIAVEVEDDAAEGRSARPLALRERGLDPPVLAAGVAQVAGDDRRQRAPRAEPDEHAEQLCIRAEAGIVGPPAPRAAKGAAGLARLVGKQLDLGRQLEHLGEPLDARRLAIHGAEHASDAFCAERGQVVAQPLRVLDHIEVRRVGAKHDQRRARSLERLAEVDTAATRGERQGTDAAESASADAGDRRGCDEAVRCCDE
mmetsp:Transcript_36176/g.121156  ORF Transcript_36176/g.121156 Transcript_36176/m.121156 type:complete len:241 (+) Transcript_36176:199-921(+)